MPKPSFVERAYRWSGRHVMVVDSAYAAGFGLFALAMVVAVPTIPVIVISLGMTVPLIWRRTRPAVSAFTIGGFGYLHLLVLPDILPISVTVLPATYAIAAYASRRASRIGLVVAVVGACAASVRFAIADTPITGIFFIAVFGNLLVIVAWAFGAMRRLRLSEVAALTERARLLELEREQEAELAAVNERTRIAREMHDIVAHSLTVVIAQADGGRYGAATDPQAAVSALETISATGRQALSDMRALLSVLREDRPRDFAATPGADDIEGLVGELRRSGLAIDYHVEGEPRELPVGTGLTVYRIAQESLTNVLKHAGPAAHAAVAVSWGRSSVRLEIADTGRGKSAALVRSAAGGQGLMGMAERARLHGGTFEAEPMVGGGFRVQAELPYEH
jgi:signal transduction histidine kinase